MIFGRYIDAAIGPQVVLSPVPDRARSAGSVGAPIQPQQT
jgi:hypothetical protein